MRLVAGGSKKHLEADAGSMRQLAGSKKQETGIGKRTAGIRNGKKTEADAGGRKNQTVVRQQWNWKHEEKRNRIQEAGCSRRKQIIPGGVTGVPKTGCAMPGCGIPIFIVPVGGKGWSRTWCMRQAVGSRMQMDTGGSKKLMQVAWGNWTEARSN
jgi:hypothetical protein